MSFIIRPVQYDDLGQLVDLAKQFNLLNLPGDKKVIGEKIERSQESFAGKLPKNKAEYLFVVEDVEEKLVVGSSLVIAKHGSEEVPHSFFKILKRDHFSQDLGIGFIHQVLRFQLDFDGPTEIGGLLVDKTYRRRPEKLGKQISLSRFLYMGLHRDRFEDRVLCELTPPLTDEGRSEFWEALGRRFTGLPYQEADLLSQSHKEFIESLFPQDDIYLALLDAKARLVLGRVGEATKPAQHLLESIGFNYLDEVDPFDGGPHYGASTEEILPIKYGRRLKVTEFKDASYKEQNLVATTSDDFKACLASVDIRGDEIAIAPISRQLLGVDIGEEVYAAPFNYNRGK
ncbi:MAG: arginine N-succinyltransferase [Bdellovibrio sp. ArHS]|uniref:arginine N-succinyltransferase n=1 Tax=Bdellovibrio sp. ArHS TaxID=1569284 RepID=UPI00058291D1|nr:arginine N-succinyltransferase [Bdellovibrio sp. ArHS]KHD88526.1 MAG: arginine N-succinyltransferase [Bdellovibrio sp. ArHS]